MLVAGEIHFSDQFEFETTVGLLSFDEIDQECAHGTRLVGIPLPTELIHSYLSVRYRLTKINT